jgi:putative ABC transport system permease protein
MRILSELAYDLRHALLGLRRDPVLALIATFTLAICIGANTTVFSLVNSILIQPLPYPKSDRVEWLTAQHLGPLHREMNLAPDYYSLREQNKVFEDVAGYWPGTVNWTGPERPEQLDAVQVSPSFFHVMGVQPVMGRALALDEEGPKAAPVVVLSYGIWHNRLGGDPQVIGRTIALNRRPTTIVGIMPQGFDFPQGAQVWTPLEFDEASQKPRQTMHYIEIVARLKPEVTAPTLDLEMARLTRNIRAEYPRTWQSNGFLDGMSFKALPLQAHLTGDVRPALLAFTAAAGLVLCTACANLANLLLARASSRRRDIAVRLALGSNRGRIRRQTLTESLALAVPGGVLGIVAGLFATGLLNSTQPGLLARYPAVSLDGRVLAFTFALTLVTSLVFGMAPAVEASRVSIHDALKSAGRTLSGGSAGLRRSLVVAELSIALMMLVGGGLVLRSFLKLAHTETGFQTSRLLTMRLTLSGVASTRAERTVQFYDQLIERIGALPSTAGVAVSDRMPLSNEALGGARIYVSGEAPVPDEQRPVATSTWVSRDFFRTLEIPLKAGRIFDSTDGPRAADRIVVNEAFVRQALHGGDAVDREIRLGMGTARPLIIAGVVGDIRTIALGAAPTPFVYQCYCQLPDGDGFFGRANLFVRTKGDPSAAIWDVEAQIYGLDRSQPVFDVMTMDDRLDLGLAPQRFQLTLIGLLAAIAILLATAGVYGLMSYLVAQRTREIGIRIAVGASPAQVLRLMMKESVPLVLLAVALGLAGAWALTRYAQSLLYGITALDAPAYAFAPMALILAVFAASLAPARRAARVDPIDALRNE